MAHSEDAKKRLLEILADTPFVNQACKTVGVHRSTFYRWKDEDPKFKARLEEVLKEGRSNIAELGELTLLKLVSNGHFGATKFLLEKNSPPYAPKTYHPSTKEEWEPTPKDFQQAHFTDDLTPHQRDVMFHWVMAENGMLRKELEKYVGKDTLPPPGHFNPPPQH